MKNMYRLIGLGCLCLLMLGGCSKTVDQALNKGTVSIRLEGIDGGKNLILTIMNRSDKAVSLLIPKGEASFPSKNPSPQKITISLPKAQTIRIEAKKEVSVTLPQAGSQRLISGNISFELAPGGAGLLPQGEYFYGEEEK